MHTHGIVPIILPIHILAGGLALVFGYVALYAAKGASLHRKSGMLFVYAMVTMSLTGALVAALNSGGLSVSVLAGLLTFYFVSTSLLTVRPRVRASHLIDAGAMLFALTLGLLALKTGFDLANTGAPETGPMFIFGFLAMLAAAGDVRMIRAGGAQGPGRITRHLWRMCFAMWVAAASFFWGPRGRVPEVIRIPPLLAVAVLLPIAAMLYWLWRIRVRRSLRGIVRVGTTSSEGLRPSDSPTRSLAGTPAPLRSRGSLALLVRSRTDDLRH